MRALRATMYPPPGAGEPITTVMLEKHLKEGVSAEAALKSMIEGAGGAFIVTEIFDAPEVKPAEDEIVVATIAGQRRWLAHRDRELDMSIGYYWWTMTLARTVPGGTIVSPKPAPLSVEELRAVFEQVRHHPSYKEQSITTVAEDGAIVQLTKEGVRS